MEYLIDPIKFNQFATPEYDQIITPYKVEIVNDKGGNKIKDVNPAELEQQQHPLFYQDVVSATNQFVDSKGGSLIYIVIIIVVFGIVLIVLFLVVLMPMLNRNRNIRTIS